MGTRWRIIIGSRIIKFIAFIMVAASITACVLLFQYMQFIGGNLESLIVDRYVDSDDFTDRVLVNALYAVSTAPRDDSVSSQEDGYRFYITDGRNEYANTLMNKREDFEKAGSRFYYLEDNAWYDGQTPNQRLQYYFDGLELERGYFVFNEEYLTEKQVQWDQGREALWPIVIMILIGCFMGLFFLVFLISVTGRDSKEPEIQLNWVDGIYSDINLLLMGSAGVFWLIAMNEILRVSSGMNRNIGLDESLTLLGEGFLTFGCASVMGVFLLSLIRKTKAGVIMRHSLIFRICSRLLDLIRSLFDGRAFSQYPTTKALHRRQWVFIVISGTLVLLTALLLLAPPLMLLPVLLEIMVIYWYIKGNNRTFMEINEGFNKSLEEQVKAERMRVDLVTNISHDLKTPLTSIISYVDLLKKEENLPGAVNDYIHVLSDKTARLKDMVADLFDLAKSTSGNISLEMESLDLKKLIEQTVADMDGAIAKSGHKVMIDLPDGPVMIFSDGQKLYRVMQNILGNAIKYAMKETRIFIHLTSDNGHAEITIKNTAGYEMDFTAVEILQRFARGDRARATEGSGLGLSIAESFTRVTGGRFRISIDGDQFKVTIAYPLQMNDTEAS